MCGFDSPAPKIDIDRCGRHVEPVRGEPLSCSAMRYALEGFCGPNGWHFERRQDDDSNDIPLNKPTSS